MYVHNLDQHLPLLKYPQQTLIELKYVFPAIEVYPFEMKAFAISEYENI